LFKDAAEILSTADNVLTSAGRAGIASGDVFVAGDGLTSSGQWDDYKVTETGVAPSAAAVRRKGRSMLTVLN